MANDKKLIEAELNSYRDADGEYTDQDFVSDNEMYIDVQTGWYGDEGGEYIFVYENKKAVLMRCNEFHEFESEPREILSSKGAKEILERKIEALSSDLERCQEALKILNSK